ncbi:MAG: TetR/AcrR family transcriptional regulator [Deltaproteobacteria bacterium]|nr:TetR/AcrR family transcriptional regulator [Candidatus Anaeroferrophillacea bacterium]
MPSTKNSDTVDNRRREKYLAIVEAALEAFAEHGYHDCQVSRIARRAGVADGTIYLYFANKEALLVSVFREKLGLVTVAARALVDSRETAWEALEALVRYHLDYLERHPVLANFFQIQTRQVSAGIRQEIAQPLKEYYRLIESLVDRGKGEGSVAVDLDTRAAREMIFGTLDEAVSCWVLSPRVYCLTDRAPLLWRLLSRALAPRVQGA